MTDNEDAKGGKGGGFTFIYWFWWRSDSFINSFNKTLDEIADGGGKNEEFVLDAEWIFEKEFTYFQPTIEVIKSIFTISLLLH